MSENINWEETIRATERSAQAASRNSENAIGGMVKLLERIDRLSSRLDAVKQDLTRLKDFQTQLHSTVASKQEDCARPFWRIQAASWLVSFVSGGAFVAFIVN